MQAHLIGDWREKKQCGYDFSEGEVQWTPRATIVFPAVCSIAGLVAGLFGVGGGVVKVSRWLGSCLTRVADMVTHLAVVQAPVLLEAGLSADVAGGHYSCADLLN